MTLAPYDPLHLDMATALRPPDSEHLMGTDQLGHNIFGRVLYGGRLSLPVGWIAVQVGVIGGGILGLSAGHCGGWIDAWLTFSPGMAITLAVLGLEMIGDGLREALDPRLRDV